MYISRAYVEELEKRVQELEVQLQGRTLHTTITQPQDKPANEGISPSSLLESASARNSTTFDSHVDNQPYFGSPTRSQPDDSNIQPNTGSEASQAPYVINAEGRQMRFFGASSGFSIASPHGVKWLEGQTQSATWNTASKRTAFRWQFSSWYPPILRENPEQRVYQPLPSKTITTQLVGEYFNNFNRVIPLFDEATFLRLVDKQFGWNPDESPSWWAALNVVLASAYRERAQKLPDGSDEWQKSMGHIRNAMNVVVEFFMRAADLLAVQAMLGLALLFQNTPNPQPLFMFAAAAMRLSQSIGLHRNQKFGLSQSQIEERRRTFWIAFILDADISHRTGRPPVQDALDFDTPLPSESPHDGLGTVHAQGVRISYFHLQARFAQIQRQVYNCLYTTSVQTKSIGEFMGALRACEEALLDWRRSFEKHYLPELAFADTPGYPLQHILRLDFAYHCCYAKLYQLCILARRSISRNMKDFPAFNKQLDQAFVNSLASARSAVKLIEFVSAFGPSYAWGVIYFPAAASVTLSSHILADPRHQHAKSDLAMARETINFLSKITSEEPGTYLDYILGLCSELENAAERATAQASQGLPPRPADDIHNPRPYSGYLGGPTSDSALQSYPGIFAPHSGSADSAGTNVLAHNYDMPSVDPTFDLAMNFQWTTAPFWNWGDMISATPTDGDIGTEQ
ncbi:hypothetical protein BBP40_009623 [Aspergillus hancockii]|nr:hypothetical protein BBP40_009623 [Aspergillus hancockii]